MSRRKFEKAEEQQQEKEEEEEETEGHFTQWKWRRFSAVNASVNIVSTRDGAKVFLEEGIPRCKIGQPWEEIDEILRAPLHSSRGILFDEGVEISERATLTLKADTRKGSKRG